MRNELTLFASAIFTATMVIAGGYLCSYAFRASPPPHALMHVEGIIALSFVALLFARGVKQGGTSKNGAAWFLGVGLAIIALAFAPTLRSPFLYDDYTHITDASHYAWRVAAQQFEQVHGRGLFFRPVGFFFYWLNYLWAGANPVWWHVSSVALHLVCCVLVYTLCRVLGVARAPSVAGAMLFGLSGIAAEPVAWIDARFDLMTTALVLASLLCVCRYASTAHRRWLVGLLAFGASGMLCKESGFCIPLLIASLAFFRDRKEWPRIWRAAAFAGVLAAILFTYRWWALGGIGGYAAPEGEASILRFNLLRSVDALLLRQWAIVFFPFNWSAPANPILRAALAAIPFALAAVGWMAKSPRRALAGCTMFILAAGLPVQHLLGIGPALGGSRQLYLGSVGLALLWAFVLNSITASRRIIVAGAFLVFEVCVLEHNLSVWRDTADLARSVCTDFGHAAAAIQGPIVVRGLPSTRMGTVFLNNGFPQCVEMNSGVPAARIQASDAPMTTPDAHEFVWKDRDGRIEAAPSR